MDFLKLGPINYLVSVYPSGFELRDDLKIYGHMCIGEETKFQQKLRREMSLYILVAVC